MEIITDRSFLRTLWPITTFLQGYPGTTHLLGYRAVSKSSDGSDDPDKTAVIILRAAIENGQRSTSGQKFMVAIRFYNFGDMATIDVVSLDYSGHRHIAYEHSRRLNCVVSEGQEGKEMDVVYGVPFIYVGAHLQVTGDRIRTHSSSGDFGDAVFSSDALAIANSVLAFCDLTPSPEDTAGSKFMASMLEFMLEHKGRPDFYEQLVRSQLLDNNKLTGQHFGGLMSMKAFDRAIAEKRDLLEIIVEELTGGFGKTCILLASPVITAV